MAEFSYRPPDRNRNGESAISVKSEVREGATFVIPFGDIDLTASPVLRQELKKIQASRPQRLVIDLAQVSYMDSSGVATLVEAMQVARRNSTRMVLCCLQERVRSIFEIARLDTVFLIAVDVETAMKQ